MKKIRIATLGVAAALAIGPAETVQAGGGDALVGGIIGGVIGGVIVNETNKSRARRVYRAPAPRMSSAQRQYNRDTQVALNYFGFPAGTPDGVMGRQSRNAVSDYQAFMGYPPTGDISDYERSFLMTSYQRAMAGGPVTMRQAAANPLGPRGLLLAYRDELAGRPPASGYGGMGDTMASMPQAPAADPFGSEPSSTMAAMAQPATAAPASAPAAVPAPAPAPEPAAAPQAGSALPSFMTGAATARAPLSSHCNKVSVQTNANGGMATSATMKDAGQALDEQFCLARSYAISTGEDLAQKVQGFTPAQIAAQCEGFGPAMKDEISAVSIEPEGEVLKKVQAFALKTGMAPAQLQATARICLSVGYKTDNMDVAIGSALLLTALGDSTYAELVGGHLADGFGVTRRPDLALDWYQSAIDAMGAGGASGIVPNTPDRPLLLRQAAYTLAGKPAAAAPATGGTTSLPSFGVAMPAKN